MKIRYLSMFIIFSLLVPLWTAPALGQRPVVRIGIVRDGPAILLSGGLEIIKDEVLALTKDEFDVHFPADKMVHGDWTVAGVKQAVDRSLADPEVDLILALGFGASHYAAQKRDLKKPVVAAAVVDARLQGFPEQKGTSGVRNLNYISPLRDSERGIRALSELVPFKSLAVLIDRNFAQTIPSHDDFRRMVHQIADDFRVAVNAVMVDTTAEAALEALPAGTDAVYVFPLIRLDSKEFQKLVGGLIRRRLPSFSVWGRDDVEKGLLVSVNAKSNIPRFARRIAVNVHRILLGEDAGNLKVAFPAKQELTINMATARAIGVYPSWGILTEARLINETVEVVTRRLSLNSAVRDAIDVNLDLAVQAQNVAAGKEAVKQARSGLLPQIDLNAGGVAIDDDRAAAGLGSTPERSLSGSVTATQLLYSDETWANYKVEQHRQTSREEQRETVKLDIALDAAVAYLNVLRAKTLERIQKDNLRLTRANLDRAHARVSIGAANRSEVYRWQTEIAGSRQDVLSAVSRRKIIENNLNRLLNRPLEERFATEETSLSDPLLIVSDPRFFDYVNNPMSFRVFRDFLVEEGLSLSPEILRIDAAMAAQQRILTSAKRAFWLPDFSVEGSVTELFNDDGKGTRDQSPFGLDNTDWSVGVFASFPLVEGGGKFATTKRAREELSGLRLERQSTSQRVEERIRSAQLLTSASYPSIRLSRQGAEASGKNLELVTDSYMRGVVSIVDLLDAQNTALLANEDAENAVFKFLIDLMRVERAVGRFDFFMTPDDREAMFQKLEAFFEKAGVQPRRKNK
jgi:outer membrane protein